MGILQRLKFRSLLRRPAPPATVVSPPAPPPTQPKTLAELEKEIEAEAIQVRAYSTRAFPRPQRRLLHKLVRTTLLLGLPIGAIWLINLPYPPIRRSIARTAPMLLLPSYISIDHSYRQAIAQVEEAEQLIEQPTAPGDLDLGAQKLEQAQVHLDRLPLWLWQDLADYSYWGYSWRLSPSSFNAARAKVGQLQAKVFQERNAQTALFEVEQALNASRQRYQQAKTAVDKQDAIAAWQTALDQLEQISGQTLAGKTAQQKLIADQRDFQAVVGLAANNQRTATYIKAAWQFGWQAAQLAKNPPHTVDQWQQVIRLWQEAIDRLQRIPPEDLAGYAEAQPLLADYKANLAQIEIRRQAEANSTQLLQTAKRQITELLATMPRQASSIDSGRLLSQLQTIINQLEQVEPGTTAYLEAQQLLLSAKNKQAQLQS